MAGVGTRASSRRSSWSERQERTAPIFEKPAAAGHANLARDFCNKIGTGALRTGLRDLGYVEGKYIVIEFRFAERIELLLATYACSGRKPRMMRNSWSGL